MNHRNAPSRSRTPSMVQALHAAVKGRARYKVRGLRDSESLKNYLEGKLSAEPGIESVRANPLTGNLLVYFDRDRPAEEIASLIAALVGHFSPSPPLPLSPRLPLSPSPPPSSWHLKDAASVAAELDTSLETGLSQAAAERNLHRYGKNALAETPPRSGWSIFSEYFKSVPVALLSGAALLSAFTGGAVDAAVIMGVVAINAILGYATESQSERIIHSLKHLVQPTAWVLRDGNLQEIAASEIAIGDLIALKPGTYVPADARLVNAERLDVDESALTGESTPVEKRKQTLADPDAPLGERYNMVYRGTFVTGGQGRAVVVATGSGTEMGQIQSLVGATAVPQTPMERQLDRTGGQLVVVSGAVCGVVFLLGLVRGYGILSMLKTSISLAVAAVPEGLPTVATTTLALGIRTMRRHRVLIRRLEAVEALGSVQAVCLDKTGTLTVNQMSVVELVAGGQPIAVADGKFQAVQGSLTPPVREALQESLTVAALCNDARVDWDGSTYRLNGSATESALLEVAMAGGIDLQELPAQYPRLATTHRSEDQNFMVTVHALPQGQQFVAVKGNPTEVLELCAWKVEGGQRLPLTDEDRQAIEEDNERMAGKGLRVLGTACARDRAPEAGTLPPDHLSWLGLIGMADPIREGVKGVMEDFHRAGIDTIMITGDQTPTAYAIGRELNLSQGEPLKTLDSTDLTDIDPEVMKGL